MKSRRRIAFPQGSRLRRLSMQLQQGFATGGMGLNGHFARQQSPGPNVRFGSKADLCIPWPMSALPSKTDIAERDWHVPLSANSGHRLNALGWPLCVKSRHQLTIFTGGEYPYSRKENFVQSNGAIGSLCSG